MTPDPSTAPTTPPNEWPSTVTRDAPSSAASAAMSAACTANPYGGSATESPCPRRSGAAHRPSHDSSTSGSTRRHTAAVAPMPCRSSSRRSPVPPVK